MWSPGGDAWGPGGWGRQEGASWSLSGVRASCALLPGRPSTCAGLRGGPGRPTHGHPSPLAHLPSDLRLWGVPGVTAPGEVWEAPWGHGHSEATSCPGSETQPPPRSPNP